MGWFDAVLGGIGSFLDSKSKEDAAKAANKDEYLWGGRAKRYQMALEDWYKQKDKQDQRAGAAEYAKFSSLDRWAPEYTNTYVPPTVPDAPPKTDEVADMTYYNKLKPGGG